MTNKELKENFSFNLLMLFLKTAFITAMVALLTKN